jgi:hypothetical protein
MPPCGASYTLGGKFARRSTMAAKLDETSVGNANEMPQDVG